jgi:hypothetical protein
MVLFPIAFIWFAIVMFWLIRNSLNEPDEQPGEPRRWYPRRPRSPHGTAPHAGQSAKRGQRFARARSNSRS